VHSKGEESEQVKFWEHTGGSNTWVRTTLLKLMSPPDQFLHRYLQQPIISFTETKQHWSKLPPNPITHHVFTILEVEDSELFISLERKDDQLEVMFGEGEAALEFMKSFRAIGRPRLRHRCSEEKPRSPGCRITLGQLLDWMDGLQLSWQPYDLLQANCQHFSAELHQFLVTGPSPESGPQGHGAIKAVFRDARALQVAPEEHRKDRRFVLAVVEQNGQALRYATEFQKDWLVVRTAVAQDGRALAHADEELKKDRAVVLAAVRQTGSALQFVGEDLRRDREVLLAAGWQDPSALVFAHTGGKAVQCSSPVRCM